MDIGGLIPLLTNALGGSVVGAVTGYLSKKQEITATKEKAVIEKDILIANNAHELEMLKLRGTLSASSEQLAAMTEELKAGYAALEASYANDRASYSTTDTSKTSPWLVAVDFIRGIMRPAITGFLVANSVVLTVYFMYVGKVDFTTQQAYDIVFLLVNNLTTCTGMAIAWYFAARTHSQGSK